MTFSNAYSARSGLVLGFHGTDESIAHDIVLSRNTLNPSNNPWDWIGHGIYFWEHSPSRALEFAQTVSKRKGSSINRPAVLGAVLNLGNCLDLLDYGNLALVKDSYENVKQRSHYNRIDNRRAPGNSSSDLSIRILDCSVIEMIHDTRLSLNQPPFDSVKAVFWEGNLLYPNAGFREKNHIQICVRNPDCIKGYFLPRIS